MDIGWLKLPIIHVVTSGLNEEELSEIEEIQLRNEGLLDGDEVEVSFGYFNVGVDTIKRLNPKCFVPKDRKRKRYYTEVVFDSGDMEWADGKPEEIYKLISEYIDSLPEDKS